MEKNNINKHDLSELRIKREQPQKRVGSGKYIKLSLWVIIPVVLLGALWLIIGSISPSIEVETAVATALTENQAQSVLSATGYVVAQRQAAVASKATGRLEILEVEEGDRVKKGELIGRLENNDMKAALDMAKAQLSQARADSLQAALNYDRQMELKKTGSTTDDVLEASRARYQGAVANVEYAQASVAAAEVALENTFIRAPFDGTVLTKYADVGEIVAPMASSASSRGALVDLADMGSLEVEADVSESNIQRVEVGQRCEIILDAYPDKRYQGRVKKIVPTADRSRATVMTKVSIDKVDKYILPEMSARINFFQADTASRIQAVSSGAAVPNAALVMRGDTPIVFTIDNGKARENEVVIGKKLGTSTEISDGIRPGQKVIVSPPSNLKPGDKVKTAE